MTTGRLGATAAPPNAAYAGQVVHFPDPIRAARYPQGVRVDEHGYPDFSPYARAAAEIADPPEGFGVDELRLTDYVSANAALFHSGHELFTGESPTAVDADRSALPVSPVATPTGWTWHHVAGSRRMELIPVEVKALLRHHGGLATAAADQDKRGTRPLQETRPVHFAVSDEPEEEGGESVFAAVSEQRLREVEEDLGYRLPGPYRGFLKASGGRPVVGVALDPELGLLIDQPFFAVRDEAATDDLRYANKCLRDHLTKDYLGIGYVQGGLLAVKVKGERIGTVWFCPYDDARDTNDGWDSPQQRVGSLLLPCGDDFDAFLLRLAGNPPELETVANLMVDGGFARAVPVEE
ncbi:SMI1/KNR4 family protein [Streptantibioticus rubrisoli]|uniref:SMI1/KNR4 family protein n=1 Tax=Streptantibioticus rubrisoli TaxID=1387313 RepID=A0ABT1PMN5_9ACTN|nr:SMI1/KNR4 family protein [Streptantibioticus rubrisoli]MCQ4046614.1 SMI1/KNR4 family protein [Streptantibioticus rubrisoli]